MSVIAPGSYRLRRLPELLVPKYVVPIEVSGPTNFVLLAVWAKRNPGAPYVEGVVRAVRAYRDLISQNATVIAGDLNSNKIWDHKRAADLSHSGLVALAAELGLTSSYHAFYKEAQGEESQATFYFQWKKNRPYHIDYVFVPETWLPHLSRVEVGSYEGWKIHSDHRPVVVTVDLPSATCPIS